MEPDDFTDDYESLDDATEWETNQVAADLVAELNDDAAERSIGDANDESTELVE